MRTSLRICMVVGSMSILLVAGSAVQAQSLSRGPVVMPAPAPASLPGYGVPVGVAPVAINAYGQPVPVYGQLVSAPPINTAGMTRLPNGQTKPAFRVTVVADETQAAPKQEPPKEEPPKEEPQAEQPDDAMLPDMDKDLGCKSGVCSQKSCGHAGDCCCFPYAFRVYGEYLYLRARDSEVCYAVETNSNLATPGGQTSPSVPIQTSPIAVLDQDFSSGFRAGFGVCLDECSEIGASYTWFDTSTEDSIMRHPDYPIRQISPMVLHPATPNAETGTAEAAGRHDIEFNLIDIEYRSFLVQGCASHLDYVLGVRWGNLEQNFAARYTDDLSQPENAYEAATDIDFDGAGLRIGLEGERYYCRVPVKLYMKGFASLMAGEFDATYKQTFASYDVDTGWKAGRIVPTFDLELGGGIYLPGGKVQATVGYVFSAWTNVVKTEDWIHAVQTNDFRDMGDTITFDGVVARVEGRF